MDYVRAKQPQRLTERASGERDALLGIPIAVGIQQHAESWHVDDDRARV
jgi:hypothetical protein